MICLLRGWFTPIFQGWYAVDGSNLWPAILILFGIGGAACSTGCMTLTWTYLAESFPTRIRSNATGLIFASARLIAVPVTLTVPATYFAAGYFGVNVVNSLWYFIPALFALVWGVNSAKKSLENWKPRLSV